MENLFHRDPRSRELRELRTRLPALQEEIARLQAYIESLPTASPSGATQTALEVRAVLARGELEELRSEWVHLLNREAELESAGTPSSAPRGPLGWRSDLAATGSSPVMGRAPEPEAESDIGGPRPEARQTDEAPAASDDPGDRRGAAEGVDALDAPASAERGAIEVPSGEALSGSILAGGWVVEVASELAVPVSPPEEPKVVAVAGDAAALAIPPLTRNRSSSGMVVLSIFALCGMVATYFLGYIGGRQSGVPALESSVVLAPTIRPSPVLAAQPPTVVATVPSSPQPSLQPVATAAPGVQPPPIGPIALAVGPEDEPAPGESDDEAGVGGDTVGEETITVAPEGAAVVIGSTGVVVPALRLRAAPTTASDQTGLMVFGTVLQVLEGVEQTPDFDWIRVRTPDGLEGWVVVDGVNLPR